MGLSIDFLPADADLSPWALGVSILRADGVGPAQFSVPAHTLAISTVMLSGELWSVDRQGQRCQMPMRYATGSATHAQGFEASPDAVCASLMCVASVLPLVTGRSADQFVNSFAAPDWLGHATDLTSALSNHALAKGLMDSLRQRLTNVRPTPGALAFLATLQQWDGSSLVPAGWHARRWQRACKHQLGVTPKLLQRLVRLHQSAQIGITNQAFISMALTTDWAEHALNAGYSDQSHMLRDYRDLAGITPARAAGGGQKAGLHALHIGANALVPRLLPGVSAVSDLSNTPGR